MTDHANLVREARAQALALTRADQPGAELLDRIADALEATSAPQEPEPTPTHTQAPDTPQTPARTQPDPQNDPAPTVTTHTEWGVRLGSGKVLPCPAPATAHILADRRRRIADLAEVVTRTVTTTDWTPEGTP